MRLWPHPIHSPRAGTVPDTGSWGQWHGLKALRRPVRLARPAAAVARGRLASRRSRAEVFGVAEFFSACQAPARPVEWRCRCLGVCQRLYRPAAVGSRAGDDVLPRRLRGTVVIEALPCARRFVRSSARGSSLTTETVQTIDTVVPGQASRPWE